MELIKIIDGLPVPYSEAAFRAANKHTVYGPVVSSRHLNAQGVYRVSKLPEPEVPVGQKAVLDAMPTQNEAGHWVIGWTLVTLGADEARALRDSLLAATDWTQVSDATVDQAAWATYRQALRDVPEQAGFPDNVTWPVKP
jgi:hypothetical protein